MPELETQGLHCSAAKHDSSGVHNTVELYTAKSPTTQIRLKAPLPFTVSGPSHVLGSPQSGFHEQDFSEEGCSTPAVHADPLQYCARQSSADPTSAELPLAVH